jgi:hypothetical protein
MIIMANGFNKSILICIMAFSLPAKRILNYIYKNKTNRYLNPYRVDIYIDIAIFACIIMWVVTIEIDKYRVPDTWN